jgi:O-antigen/teichoic acid export membrane protein
VTLLEFVGNGLRFAGLVVTIVGLWFSAGGVRVVVSGRIDERRRSALSLKKSLILLVVGIVLLIFGTWLVASARRSAVGASLIERATIDLVIERVMNCEASV